MKSPSDAFLPFAFSPVRSETGYLRFDWRLQCSQRGRGYLCFSRIFCCSSCPRIVQNTIQKFLQRAIFHAFADVFLEDRCRYHVLHNCRTFSGKFFLFASRKNSGLRSHSAYIRSHLHSFSGFHCGSIHTTGLGFSRDRLMIQATTSTLAELSSYYLIYIGKVLPMAPADFHCVPTCNGH